MQNSIQKQHQKEIVHSVPLSLSANNIYMQFNTYTAGKFQFNVCKNYYKWNKHHTIYYLFAESTLFVREIIDSDIQILNGSDYCASLSDKLEMGVKKELGDHRDIL